MEEYKILIIGYKFLMKTISILGSTGSIGRSALNIVKKDPSEFRVKLLTTNRNVKKIYNQA